MLFASNRWAALCVALSMVWSAQTLAKFQPVMGMAAVVGDVIITTSMLDAAMHDQAIATGDKHAPTFEARQRVLAALIDRQLLLTEAAHRQMTVQKSDIDRAIGILATRQHMSVSQFKKFVVKRGGTMATLRHKVRDQILIERVQPALLSEDDRPNRKAVHNWWLAHRFDGVALQLVDWHLPSNAMPIKAAKTTAQSWANMLREAGTETPASLPGIVKQSMPMMAWRDLPDAFVSAIQKQPRHTVLGPIQTQNGQHILQIIKRQGHPLSLSRAQMILFQQTLTQQMPKIMARLRQQTYIQKFDG